MKKMAKGIFTGILVIAVGLMLASGASAAQTKYCKDLDLDGYGDPADCEAEFEEGLVDNALDCNDDPLTGININPAAEDVCGDLIDNNCMDGIDEGCPGAPTGKISYCIDQDGDGYGASVDCVPDPEPGYIANDGDCNDDPLGGGASINPGEIEICGDGINNNCVNGIDEGCSTTDNRQYYYLDSDNDGYGDQTIWEYVVNPSAGYVTNPGDCATSDPAINPAASEVCSTTDLTDENCDTVANEGCSLWWEDADGDSYTSGVNYFDSIQQTGYVLDTSLVSMELDCNDDPFNGGTLVNPGAEEIYGDQIDQNCDGVIILFADLNLETCVLEHTGGSMDPVDMASLTSLVCRGRSISDLTGMEYLTGLTSLDLQSNYLISDITPLATLTNLVVLTLDQNSISDPSPLANLTGLTRLYLHNNNISDLAPLANLTRLNSLGLYHNAISDLSPLANLTTLIYLNVRYNTTISDLTPLANLTGLSTLYLDSNAISDLTPLANLTGLSRLYLSNNAISDLTPLANLTGLSRLGLYQNAISDLSPLANLTRLSVLYLFSNAISDLTPLVNLTELYSLQLGDNNISDLTPLANFTGGRLYYLYLDKNYIRDLTPLANLTTLGNLKLTFNCITDFTPVAHVLTVRGTEPYYQQECI